MANSFWIACVSCRHARLGAVGGVAMAFRCASTVMLDKGVTAVDDDRLTDHEVGVLAAQIVHQGPEFLGSTHPPTCMGSAGCGRIWPSVS